MISYAFDRIYSFSIPGAFHPVSHAQGYPQDLPAPLQFALSGVDMGGDPPHSLQSSTHRQQGASQGCLGTACTAIPSLLYRRSSVSPVAVDQADEWNK